MAKLTDAEALLVHAGGEHPWDADKVTDPQLLSEDPWDENKCPDPGHPWDDLD